MSFFLCEKPVTFLGFHKLFLVHQHRAVIIDLRLLFQGLAIWVLFAKKPSMSNKLSLERIKAPQDSKKKVADSNFCRISFRNWSRSVLKGTSRKYWSVLVTFLQTFDRADTRYTIATLSSWIKSCGQKLENRSDTYTHLLKLFQLTFLVFQATRLEVSKSNDPEQLDKL